jgi:hypothetical protein
MLKAFDYLSGVPKSTLRLPQFQTGTDWEQFPLRLPPVTAKQQACIHSNQENHRIKTETQNKTKKQTTLQ